MKLILSFSLFLFLLILVAIVLSEREIDRHKTEKQSFCTEINKEKKIYLHPVIRKYCLENREVL